MNIFFSYARADSDFALKLAGDMRSAGFDVWIDQLDIPVGARWDERVETALRSCSCLLIVLSPVSVASQNVMDEVAFAIDQSKTILPVLHRSCEIPFRLRRLQYIDFTADYATAFTRSLAALTPGCQAIEREKGSAKPSLPLRITTNVLLLVAIALLVGTLEGRLVSGWRKVSGPTVTANATDVSGNLGPNRVPQSEGAARLPAGVQENQPWVVVGKNEVVPVDTSAYPGSNGYRYAGEGVTLAAPDNMEFPRRSRLLLLENGIPLGPRASSHAEIQAKGEGRYSHWSDTFSTYLYFSTSDNSDPRHNKRTYVVTVSKE